MMIVMAPGATKDNILAVTQRVEAVGGVHVMVIHGEVHEVIAAIGDADAVRELGLEGMDGVDRVVPISRPYKLASNEIAHHEPSVFDIAGRKVGGGDTFCLIAGPC